MAHRRPTAVIKAEILEYEAKLVEAKATLSKIAGTPNVRNRFDDNEGSQSLEKRDLSKQTAYIDWLNDELLKLNNELYGRTTIVRHRNRRNISGEGLYL